MLRVTVVSDLNAALEQIRQFAERHRPENPFMLPGWLSAWAAHRAPAGRPEVLFFETEAAEVVGYAPFWVRRLPLGPELYCLMGEGTANILGIIAAVPYEEVMEALAAYLQGRPGGAVLRLYDVDERTELAKHLSHRSDVRPVRLYDAPLVEMPQGWEAYAKARLKGKRRSRLNRYEQRLASLGEVRTVLISDTETLNRYRHLVERTFELHRLRFQGVLNTSGFSDARWRPFYEQLLTETAAEGSLHLSIVTLDSHVVAFVLSFRAGDCVVDCIPAFEPTLAPFTLGHVHLHLLIQEMAEAGVKVLDLSKGDGPHKLQWETSISGYWSFHLVYGRNPVARLWGALLAAAEALKAALRQRGITERVKRWIGSLRGGRGQASLPMAKPSPVAEGWEPVSAQPLRYTAARGLDVAICRAVFDAVSRGATAQLTEAGVLLTMPDGARRLFPVQSAEQKRAVLDAAVRL